MKKLLLLVLILFIQNISAQNIKIGEDGEYAKILIERSVYEQNRSNPLKKPNKPYWTTDTKYNNSVLTEISLCKLNQPITGLTISTDFCEYCIIKDGKINSIIKEFKSLNLESVKDFYIRNYNLEITDGLYFTTDYSSYYNFYLSENKRASVELKETIISELPKKIQNIILQKKQLAEIETAKKKQQEEAEQNKILNDTIDLKDFDINTKASLQSEFENAFLKEFFTAINKDFNNYIVKVANIESDKMEIYSNTFKITYIQPYKSNFPISPKKVLSLVNKNDFTELMKLIKPRFSKAYIYKYGTKTFLNTKAEINDLSFSLIRGKIDVKKTNKNLLFSGELNEAVKKFITNELTEENKGKYTVVYEYGKINNYKIQHLIVLTENEKMKMKNFK